MTRKAQIAVGPDQTRVPCLLPKNDSMVYGLLATQLAAPCPLACVDTDHQHLATAAAVAGFQPQVLVVGPRYGSWGTEKYGVTPSQVDALEFYPAVLQEKLKELIALQQDALHGLSRPAAVVTFR